MTIENKYVSVIIPTYNREKTIYRAIMSVLNQTYKNLEVIVVDDCSTDQTKKIVKNIEDKRLKYIKLDKNSGANFARNKGIELAKYDLVAFQDSDDEWHNNKLEIQLKYMTEDNLDFIATSYNQYINDKFNSIIPREKIEKDYLKRILISNYVGTGTLIVKRNIMLKEKFNKSLPRLQDYELAIRLFKKYKGKFINIPLVDAYIQDNSISKNEKNLLIAMKKILKINRLVYKENPKILSKKYLEIYLLSILNEKKEKKYLLLSLKYNLGIKNVIFIILDKISCEKSYKILKDYYMFFKKYIRRRK